MSTAAPVKSVSYPDDDGNPMSDNTLQFQWIATLVGNLQALYRDDPNVFVGGNLLWYPVEGDNVTRTAPDALVVFGRPKGYRGSYMQWKEEGVAPQVVFEVRSPGNRVREMLRKFHFYERFGVEEYYILNPDPVDLEGWRREGERLIEVPEMNGWVSPQLGIRFTIAGDELRVLGPDGRPFETYEETAAHRDEERRRADEERRRAELLAEKLRRLGIDPDA